MSQLLLTAKASWRTKQLLRQRNGDDDDVSNCSDPEELVEDGGRALRPNSSFQKATRRLWYVQRWASLGTGVRHRHLLTFGNFHSQLHTRSVEREEFVAKMLNHVPMMAKVTNILMRFKSPLLGGSEKLDQTRLLDLIFRSLHDIRKITTQVAWFEHVQPLKAEIKEIVLKHDSLRKQFKEARCTYLQEVAQLRDKVRVRGDPLATLDLGEDIISYFEPTELVDDQELKFFVDLMREKFKMMSENNPKLVKTLDFGQMEKILAQVESQEIKVVKEKLQEANEEISQLRLHISHSAMSGSGQDFSSMTEKKRKIAEINREYMNTKIIKDLENKLSDIRDDKVELEEQLKDAVSAKDVLEHELHGVAAELRSQTADKMMLQDEVAMLRLQVDCLAETESSLEETKLEVRAKEDNIKQLRLKLQRMERQLHTHHALPKLAVEKEMMDASSLDFKQEAGKEAITPSTLDLTCNSSRGNGPHTVFARRRQDTCEPRHDAGSHCLPPLEADAAAGNHRNVSGISDIFQHGKPERDDSPEPPSQIVSETLQQPPAETDAKYGEAPLQELATEHMAPELVDDHDMEVSALRSKCVHLQHLVQMHIEEETRIQVSAATEEAQDLALLVESLGACELGWTDDDAAECSHRVCRCGNMLMEDCKFCRRCGQEWTPSGSALSASRRQCVAHLSLKLNCLASQLEECIDQLNQDLTLDTKDPHRAIRIAESQKKITRLKREQQGYETQLLVERAKASLDDAETLEHLETCNCSCFSELAVTKDMNKQLRTLCSEMYGKIKHLTHDNVQLNSALDKTLTDIDTAMKFVKSTSDKFDDEDLKKGLAALSTARHDCVFSRLFEASAATKNKWKERKMKLMQDSLDATQPRFILAEDDNPSALIRVSVLTKEKPAELVLEEFDLETFIPAPSPCGRTAESPRADAGHRASLRRPSKPRGGAGHEEPANLAVTANGLVDRPPPKTPKAPSPVARGSLSRPSVRRNAGSGPQAPSEEASPLMVGKEDSETGNRGRRGTVDGQQTVSSKRPSVSRASSLAPSLAPPPKSSARPGSGVRPRPRASLPETSASKKHTSNGASDDVLLEVTQIGKNTGG